MKFIQGLIFLAVVTIATFIHSAHADLVTETGRRFVDLGYTLGENTIFYPNAVPFQLTRDSEGWRDNGSYWYSSFSFCMGEHGGTHLDAPYHFYKYGWKLDEIPPSRLIDIPATIINVQSKVLTNDDSPLESPGGTYKLSVGDLMEHEKEFGQIPPKSLVLIYTGWSKFWPHRTNYLGYQEQEDATYTLRFPSVSVAAIKWLSEERQIIGIGLDAASLDGADNSNPVHIYGASKGIFNLKNVANLHLLVGDKKQTGLRVFVMPVKIVGGSGAPVRILAQVP